MTIGEGSHDVELRAVDGAGSSETQSLSIDVDTQSPIADLDASPSFCPGCGETLDITVVAQDGGSGIAAWSLTASGRTVASGSGAIGQTITWDGGGLGARTHTLELEARDEAGNDAGASFDFGLIAPTPGPQDDSSNDTGAGSSPSGSATPASTPTPTRTPRATPAASTVNFGPSTSLGAGLPAAPAGDSASDLQSPISDVTPGSSPAVLPPSGVVFGGAALALAGVATAIALETTRRRRKEEEQLRLEMERKNAQAEAREAAQRAALAQARSDAEFNLILGQIWDQATGGHGPSNAWMLGAAVAVEATRRRPTRIEDEPPPPLPEWKEAMLEPKVPPPSPPPPPLIDLAKWKHMDYAAGEAWEAERPVQQRRTNWLGMQAAWEFITSAPGALKGYPPRIRRVTIPVTIPRGFGLQAEGTIFRYTVTDGVSPTIIRSFGRAVGDALVPVSLPVGWFLSVAPSQIDNYERGAPVHEYAADLMVDSVGFGVSEVVGKAALAGSSGTGPLAFVFAGAADLLSGLAYDVAVERTGIRAAAVESLVPRLRDPRVEPAPTSEETSWSTRTPEVESDSESTPTPEPQTGGPVSTPVPQPDS